jgi:hypothetical protein
MQQMHSLVQLANQEIAGREGNFKQYLYWFQNHCIACMLSEYIAFQDAWTNENHSI